LKKNSILFIVFVVVFLASCSQSVEYSILDEETANNMAAVSVYIEELESRKSDFKGYKVFDTSGGKKIVVISTGEPNKTFKVHKVEKSSKDTAITIVQTELPSEQRNSFVVIRLDEIVGAFYVFERVQYEGTQK
jgi:type III secretory pathway lipoprotein EscJ